MLVGTLVTVVSALVPARRATKALPIEALREAPPGAEKLSKRRAVIGAVLPPQAPRRALCLYGAAPMPLFGIGLVAALGGVIVSLPLAVRPLAALIGAPMRFGVSRASWRSSTPCATRVVLPRRLPR